MRTGTRMPVSFPKQKPKSEREREIETVKETVCMEEFATQNYYKDITDWALERVGKIDGKCLKL